jgi:hypothetical protein
MREAGVYKLIFRGELLDGVDRQQGQTKLANLFKLSPEKAHQLFDGKTRVLRKNMDKATAAKFQQAFKQAGLKAYFQAEQVAAVSSSDEKATKPVTSAAPPLSIAPAGSDLLASGERTIKTPVDINTDHLSTAAVGSNIGDKHEEEALAHINTEHFDLAELGSIMADAMIEEITLVDIPEISLAEVGSTLGDDKPLPVIEVDTEQFTLSPSGSILQDEKDELPPSPPNTAHLSLTPNDTP